MNKPSVITAICVSSALAFSVLTANTNEEYYDSDTDYAYDEDYQDGYDCCDRCYPCCIPGDCCDNWMVWPISYPSRKDHTWYDRLTR